MECKTMGDEACAKACEECIAACTKCVAACH